jgi:Flp pilus assembly protein TadG
MRFIQDKSGTAVVVLGLALPALVGGVAAAVDHANLASRRAKLQVAADTAALAAAKEFGIANADNARIAQVAKVVASSRIAGDAPGGTNAVADARVINGSDVEVHIRETVKGALSNLVGLPTAELQVRAVAHSSGSVRLCLLALETADPAAIGLNQSASLTAERCSVLSNSRHPLGIVSRDGATLRAERICSVGGASGTGYMPAPLTDCPARGDPLASRPAPAQGACDHTNHPPINTSRALSPGVYCGGLRVMGGAAVSLSPGTYVMRGGPLVVSGSATLSGENAGFYLTGQNASFNFGPQTTISLSAPKTGAMAGILFFRDRAAAPDQHFILSNNARRLVGTIYLPNSLLQIDAARPVADQSAYTVIVARQVRLFSGPNLVLNSNYNATDVPVPDGVGPLGANVSLVQ